MTEIAQDSGGFATNSFGAALARLQIQVEEACLGALELGWQAQVAAAVRTVFVFALADPAAARALTSEALAGGSEGYARYDRMLDHFGGLLLPGRDLRPEGQHLPDFLERSMASGVAMLVAQRLDQDRQAELPAIAPEAIQFVLTPYIGIGEARRVAAASLE